MDNNSITFNSSGDMWDMSYTVEIAKKEDEKEILDLIYRNYLQETDFRSFDPDIENTKKFIKNWIENFCFIGKDKNGAIIGIISFYGVHSYFKQLEMEVDILYVLPEWRGTGLSRDLVSNLINQSDKNGVSAIYTSCRSRINDRNDKLYQNLFSKFGFDVLGTELVRINHG